MKGNERRLIFVIPCCQRRQRPCGHRAHQAALLGRPASTSWCFQETAGWWHRRQTHRHQFLCRIFAPGYQTGPDQLARSRTQVLAAENNTLTIQKRHTSVPDLHGNKSVIYNHILGQKVSPCEHWQWAFSWSSLKHKKRVLNHRRWRRIPMVLR